MTATERVEGAGFRTTRQKTSPAAVRAMRARAGRRYRLSLNVTVISWEGTVL
jgi:hypothetical protein